MLNNDQVKRQSIMSRDSRASSAPHAFNENMFILDVSKLNIKNNYSNLFGSKKIEQTDEEFKETWDKLKYMQRPMKRGSNDNINVENYSLKEEAMLGDEFLGMINSPTKSRRKESNLSSNYSDEDASGKNRRISTGSISKFFKFTLDGIDDKETLLAEFREFKRKFSIKKNNNNNPPSNSDLQLKTMKEGSNNFNEYQKTDEEMCSPLIQLKDLRINNLNEEYENTDLLNKLSNQENNNFNPNKVVNEKENGSTNFSLYQTFTSTDDTFKTRSETHSRQNFIPKDQLYKQSLNSIQTNSPIIPMMNNFQYYESPKKISNINHVNNLSPLMFNNNDSNSFYQYPFNFNQTNNYYGKQQPNIQINSSILINNRPITNIYTNSTPVVNSNNHFNNTNTPYISSHPIKNNYQMNNFNYNNNYNNENVNNSQQQIMNNKAKMQNKTNYVNYNEMDNIQLISNLNTIGRDQTGCRLLQKKIQEDKSFLNNYLYPTIVPNLLQFMNDNFGNYLVQKIIEEVGYDKRKEIILIIQPSFLSLGLSPHGTRVIQKIIESICTFPDLISMFIEFFEPHILPLIKDVNGNHIIIKFVNAFKSPINQFVFNHINDNVVDIATDKHGCCAIQKCIDAADNEQKKFLVSNIIKHTHIFILNQYANYVLQLIVTQGNQLFNRDLVIEILKNNIDFLSKQRFSSNVIEKCFDYFSQEYQTLLIKEISKEEIITSLLFNMYGNYVLQKALQLSTEPYYTTILTHIAKNLDQLKNYSSFGSKLYFKLINTYPVLNNIKSNHQIQNNAFNYNDQNTDYAFYNNTYSNISSNETNNSFNVLPNRNNRKIPRRQMNMH